MLQIRIMLQIWYYYLYVGIWCFFRNYRNYWSLWWCSYILCSQYPATKKFYLALVDLVHAWSRQRTLKHCHPRNLSKLLDALSDIFTMRHKTQIIVIIISYLITLINYNLYKNILFYTYSSLSEATIHLLLVLSAAIMTFLHRIIAINTNLMTTIQTNIQHILFQTDRTLCEIVTSFK